MEKIQRSTNGKRKYWNESQRKQLSIGGQLAHDKEKK